MDFAQTLRKLREQAGISQVDLAEAIDMHPSHLNRIEAGVRNPPRQKNVLAIARALKLTPDEKDKLLLSAGYAPKELEGQIISHPLAQMIGEDIDGLLQAIRNGVVSQGEKERIEMWLGYVHNYLEDLRASLEREAGSSTPKPSKAPLEPHAGVVFDNGGDAQHSPSPRREGATTQTGPASFSMRAIVERQVAEILDAQRFRR